MLPIIVVFWQDCGLDMLQIFWLHTLFAISVVVLEVPTGMVADRLGKRTSLLFGMVVIFAGMIGYALSQTFVSFLLVEIALALGFAFYSGADSALLYDSLKALKREDEFKRIEGETNAIRLVSFALCNLIGGVVGDWSLVGAVWASAIGPCLGIFVVFGFVEVQPRDAQENMREALRSYRQLLRQALKFVRKHQYVRWQILLFSVLSGSGTWLVWLYQPYMAESGLDIWAFGGAFALFNLVAALCSKRAHEFETRLGGWRSNLVFALLLILPLLLMATFIGPLSFLFILGHQAVRGFARPIITDRILQYTYADKRATVLSLNSMGGRLFFALTGPLVGWLSDVQPMSVCLQGQAGSLLILFIVLGWMYLRIPKKYFEAKALPG
jgi:MFS family permease